LRCPCGHLAASPLQGSVQMSLPVLFCPTSHAPSREIPSTPLTPSSFLRFAFLRTRLRNPPCSAHGLSLRERAAASEAGGVLCGGDGADGRGGGSHAVTGAIAAVARGGTGGAQVRAGPSAGRQRGRGRRSHPPPSGACAWFPTCSRPCHYYPSSCELGQVMFMFMRCPSKLVSSSR